MECFSQEHSYSIFLFTFKESRNRSRSGTVHPPAWRPRNRLGIFSFSSFFGSWTRGPWQTMRLRSWTSSILRHIYRKHAFAPLLHFRILEFLPESLQAHSFHHLFHHDLGKNAITIRIIIFVDLNTFKHHSGNRVGCEGVQRIEQCFATTGLVFVDGSSIKIEDVNTIDDLKSSMLFHWRTHLLRTCIWFEVNHQWKKYIIFHHAQLWWYNRRPPSRLLRVARWSAQASMWDLIFGGGHSTFDILY